jgi:hypothetical protein
MLTNESPRNLSLFSEEKNFGKKMSCPLVKPYVFNFDFIESIILKLCVWVFFSAFTYLSVCLFMETIVS